MYQQFINGAYIFYPCHEVSLVAKLVFIRPIAEQSGNMAEIICNDKIIINYHFIRKYVIFVCNDYLYIATNVTLGSCTSGR